MNLNSFITMGIMAKRKPLSALFAKTIERLVRADVNTPVFNCRGSLTLLSEIIDRQYFPLRAGFKHADLSAIVYQIDFPIGRHG